MKICLNYPSANKFWKKRFHTHSKKSLSNTYKKRLDLSCIITKTWSGEDEYLRCTRRQDTLGYMIHVALEKVHFKHNLDQYYEEFCTSILDICEVFLSTESPTLATFQRKNAFWFDCTDKKVQHLLKMRDILSDLHNNNPDDMIIQRAYDAIKVKSKKELRQMENKWWVQQGLFMEQKARESQTKTFYQALKKTYGPQRSKFMPQMVKNLDGSVLSNPKQVRERWKQHFDELLNQQTTPSINLDDYFDDHLTCWELNDPPTLEELQNAVKNLANHKAPNDDGMVNEIFKYAGSSRSKRKLLDIFIFAWNTGQLPSLMCKATFIPIFKKGDRLECNNYRGIAILSQCLKILSKIIYNRIEAYCEKFGIFKDTQNGFRRRRGRQDLILIIRYIQSLFQEKNLNLYLAFIDIIKAYDSVQRELIWKALKKIGLPPKLIKMIQTIYQSIECRVRVEGKDSDPFSILVGLLQGDSNSTLIFNIIFSMIVEISLQRLEQAGVKLRVRIDKNFFKILKSRSKGEIMSLLELIFADDTCLCSENEEHLQLAVQIFSEVSLWFGLKVSTDKTEIMLQRAKYSASLKRPSIFLDGQSLKVCHEFKYLGSVISDDAQVTKEVFTRIHRAKAAFSKLYQRVWSRNTLSLKTKISVYRTMILPILTQDCETLHLTHSNFKKLEGCQYKFLRTMCNKKWEDFVHYTELFDLLNDKQISLPLIEVSIRMKRLSFFNKILSMSTDRLIKKVLFSDALNGKRKSGRPLLSWRQAITQDIKFFDMTDIMLDDNYPQYTTSGQLKLEKRFSVVDDQKKSILRAKRDTRHKGYKLILV